MERGAVCDRIEDRELLNTFVNSAAARGQRNAFELHKVLPKDATLMDLPAERFLQMLVVAVAPKTEVEFTSKWVAYMEEYIAASHFNALGKVSDYNMHVKYSAFESFLLELELSYDVLEELADKCAEHGLRIEYPDFKGNFGTFEAMDLIVHKSDNYVLQQVYQTAKKDPSVVVEDSAYAGGEAEGRDNARNDKRLSSFRGRRREQLRQKKKPVSKVLSVDQLLRTVKKLLLEIFKRSKALQRVQEKPNHLKARKKNRLQIEDGDLRVLSDDHGQLQHVRPTRKPPAPPVPHVRNLSTYDCYDDDEYEECVSSSRRLSLYDDEDDEDEPALAYMQRNTGKPMKAPHQKFSSQNNAYDGPKVCSSGMFTGFCRGCQGCTNMSIEDHKRAIVCFEAQLADRGETHSRHAKNIAAHKKALAEGKVLRYYPRPEGDAAKSGGPLKNQALTKNKFDKRALNAVQTPLEDMSRAELLALLQASQDQSATSVRVNDESSSSDSD